MVWDTLVGNVQDSMWRSPQIRRCLLLPETSGAGLYSRGRMGCCGYSAAGAYKDLTTYRGSFLCTGATPHCNALQPSPWIEGEFAAPPKPNQPRLMGQRLGASSVPADWPPVSLPT